jgi:YVTN family beta-propeller protein
VSSSATGTISTTVLNLAGGSSYTFEVTATDAYGQASAASGASAPVTPYTSSDPVPTGLALTAGNGAVSATWAAVTGGTINGYDLYTNGMLAKSVLGISTTSAALSGLTNGTTYAVTIASTDSSGGVSHQSAAMYVTPSAYAGQVVSDGASSYLQLNDPSGATTAADVSGHSANGGTIATAGVAEGGAAANSILGGGSYTISGSSSTNGGNSGYVKVPASQFPATVASPGLTLETWLKTTATGGSLMGVQTAVPGSTPGSYFNTFYVGTNGELYGGQYNSGAGVKVCASSGTVTSGAWQLADLVYTATSLTLYLNGTQVCTESDGAAAFPSSGSYAQWGAAYSTVSDWTNSGAATGWHYFNGQLADSTIYQTALSASQVLNHYELGSGTAVAPSGLMVTQGSGPSASLSWTAGAGTTSYSIFRNSGGGAFSSLVSGLTSPSYSDTTVGYGASYGYYVVALSSTGTASSPSGTEYITPNPQEMVYVSNYTAGTVSAINEANNSTLATITVGTNPAGLAVSPNGQQVYVANRGGSVSVINTATDTVAATISVGNSPNWVAFTPNGAYAYVESCGGSGCGAVSTGSVSVINTATDQVVTGTGYPIAVGTTAHAIAISPNGTEAFVANEAASTISEIAIAPSGLPSSTTATTFTTGVTNPWDLAVTPNGNTLYVADGNGYATTFNNSCTSACVATGSVSGLASGPNGIGFNPTGTYAYVTSSAASSNSTAAINTSTLVATSISIGAGSLGTAGTPDGNYVYVANTSSNNISVVSLNPATGAPTCYTTCPTLTETGGPAGVATAYVPELVPTGVSASVNASGAAVIGWTAAAGASSYDVYRNGVLLQGAVSGTSYTDSTVVPGTTYSYYVTAVNASGLQSASSTTVYVTPSAYAAQVLADSPTYYWQLDEPTVTSPVGDISASHAGTGTSYTAGDTMQVSGTGSLGTAVGFTGGASRILGSEAWTDTGNASVELWFNTANAVSGYPLIAGNYAVLWVGTDGHLHGSWNGVTTAADNVVSSTTLAANTWYMADLTKSGTTLTLYVNGAQVAQTTTDGGAGGPGSFQVGGGYVEPSQPGAAASGNYTFTGSMSDVSAYSSALSAAQVSLDYDLGSGTAAVPSGLTVALNASDHPVLSWTTGAGDISYDVYRSGTEIASPATTIYTDTAALTGTTDGYYVTAVSSTGAQSSPTSTVYVTPSVYAAQVVVDNPVAYYQMDEPAGTVTGANLVGSTSSATYPSSSVAMGATSSNPVAGSAMDITGGTAAPTFVLSSTPSNTGGSYETAEFWMDWNGTINSSGETVFATSTGAANYSLYIRTVSGTTYIGINTSNGGDIYGEIIPSTVANHWVLVDAEFAYDAASSSKLFINGAPQTLAQEIGTPANGNATFSGTDEVSQPSSAYDVNGYFQDLSVYASALSAAQILNDYYLGTVGVGDAGTPTATASLGSVALSWPATTGAASYDIFRNGALLYTAWTGGTSYTDSSVTNGDAYYYQVAAVAPGGSPTATSPSSATVVAGMVPASGTGLSGSEIEGVQTLTTSASTSYTGDPASAAFDNNTSTNWNAGTYSGSVQATWPVAEYLSAVHIWTSASPAQTVTITVYGYNGSSWVQIGSASPSIGTSTAETTVTLTSPGSYTGVKVSMSSASTWVDDAETTFN